jgi:hypothetical protein
MTVEKYRRLYTQNGFFWNNHLVEFVQEFGEKVINYRHDKTGTPQTARFCLPVEINVGRAYGQHETTVHFLKEEIAPVGVCNADHIQLLLTEKGRLIGFADYLLLRWGEENSDWRSSILKLLQSEAPTKIGVIPSNSSCLKN